MTIVMHDGSVRRGAQPTAAAPGLAGLRAAVGGRQDPMPNDAGVRLVVLELPGTAHEWLTWRRGPNDFARLRR